MILTLTTLVGPHSSFLRPGILIPVLLLLVVVAIFKVVAVGVVHGGPQEVHLDGEHLRLLDLEVAVLEVMRHRRHQPVQVEDQILDCARNRGPTIKATLKSGFVSSSDHKALFYTFFSAKS